MPGPPKSLASGLGITEESRKKAEVIKKLSEEAPLSSSVGDEVFTEVTNRLEKLASTTVKLKDKSTQGSPLLSSNDSPKTLTPGSQDRARNLAATIRNAALPITPKEKDAMIESLHSRESLSGDLGQCIPLSVDKAKRDLFPSEAAGHGKREEYEEDSCPPLSGRDQMISSPPYTVQPQGVVQHSSGYGYQLPQDNQGGPLLFQQPASYHDTTRLTTQYRSQASSSTSRRGPPPPELGHPNVYYPSPSDYSLPAGAQPSLPWGSGYSTHPNHLLHSLPGGQYPQHPNSTVHTPYHQLPYDPMSPHITQQANPCMQINPAHPREQSSRRPTEPEGVRTARNQEVTNPLPTMEYELSAEWQGWLEWSKPGTPLPDHLSTVFHRSTKDLWAGLKKVPEWLTWRHFLRLLGPVDSQQVKMAKLDAVRHNLLFKRAFMGQITYKMWDEEINTPAHHLEMAMSSSLRSVEQCTILQRIVDQATKDMSAQAENSRQSSTNLLVATKQMEESCREVGKVLNSELEQFDSLAKNLIKTLKELDISGLRQGAGKSRSDQRRKQDEDESSVISSILEASDMTQSYQESKRSKPTRRGLHSMPSGVRADRSDMSDAPKASSSRGQLSTKGLAPTLAKDRKGGTLRLF